MLDLVLSQNQVTLSGLLDKHSSQDLWNKRAEFLTIDNKTLSIELSKIEKIDSAGLATLLALYREANLKGIPFVILNAPKQLRDLAAVNGVLEILPFK